MNPYQYRAPPVGIELFPRLQKMNFTVRPLGVNIGSHVRPRAMRRIVGVSLGMMFGVILTSLMKHMILKPHLCLSKRSISMYHDMDDAFRIIGLDKNKNIHNSAKNLVFVGIMTANNFLDTRAKTVYETWGKLIPGRIAFFSSETSSTVSNIPLITLNGVDDTYPPQKKAFMMLKYMADHFGDHFEFFMRADDDVYVRTDRLEGLLRSVNSTHPQFIGQAGRGIPEEIGNLGLKADENFCMGGPGVILSRTTLKLVVPYIKECLKNLKTTHEDVEVGRCVTKHANLPCTWAFEMQNIFFHHMGGTEAFGDSLKSQEIHQAITLHPVKNPSFMYRLHSYMQGLSIKASEGEIVHLSRELARTTEEARLPLPQLDNPTTGVFISHLGQSVSLQKWNADLEEEVLPWDFVSQSAFQFESDNPRHKIASAMNEGLIDITRDFMNMINRVSKERGRVIEFKDALYGYIRWHPSFATEYILDLLLLYKKYRGKKMTVPVRRHAYLQVALGPLYVRESDQECLLESQKPNLGIKKFVEVVVKNGLSDLSRLSYKVPSAEPSAPSQMPKKIHFILPLAGRLKIFQLFLDNYKSVCLEKGENVRLVVVSFRPPLGEEDTRENVEALISSMQLDYPRAEMTVLQANASFSRALGLALGASLCEEDDLMFFIDVDMMFSTATVNRVRIHTIQKTQMYYPVVFSEFDPEFSRQGKTRYDSNLIDEEVGYWRVFGYGIAALYKSDLQAVGGLDISILGWGKEDVDLYDKSVKSVQIFRAADPGLVHIFHRKACDSTLEASQYQMCMGTLYNTYGSTQALVKTILQKPGIIEYKRSQS